MYKQLGLYPEILAYLLRYRIHVIHLVRQNHLDVMLCYAVKAKIGRAHLLVGQSAPDKLQVELDTRNLVSQFTWLQQQQNIARRLLTWCRLPHLEVAYEDWFATRIIISASSEISFRLIPGNRCLNHLSPRSEKAHIVT